MNKTIALYLFLFCLIFGNTLSINAQNRKDLEAERAGTMREIEELNRFISESKQHQAESLHKLDLLTAQVKQYNRLISGINSELLSIDEQIRTENIQIRLLQEQVQHLKDEYARMLVFAYQNRGKFHKLSYILASSGLTEAYRRIQYFQQYSDYRQKQVADIQKTEAQLKAKVDQLAAIKADKKALLQTQQQEQNRLEGVKNQQNAEVKRLQKEEKALKQKLAAQQKRAKQLEEQIQTLIANENKKRKAKSKNLYDNLTPEEKLISNNFKDNKGRLPWPTEKGIMTRGFGKGTHPLFKDITIDNDGIDITTPAQAPVRAIFDGEVTLVSGILGENISVFIRHGSYISIYQNLVNVSVKQGDKVKAKQNIGKVYTESGSTSAVFHFGLWNETQKQNPELWLSKKQ